MANVTMKRCDACGKLADSSSGLPKGWRHFEVLFDAYEVDVCSPGCAKVKINEDIDAEWERTDGTPTGLVSSDHPIERTRHPVERPVRPTADASV